MNKKLLVVILCIALAGAVVLALVLNSCEKQPGGAAGTTQQTSGKTGEMTTGETGEMTTGEMTTGETAEGTSGEVTQEATENTGANFNDFVGGNADNGDDAQDDTDETDSTEGGKVIIAPPAATEEGDIRIPLGDLGG